VVAGPGGSSVNQSSVNQEPGKYQLSGWNQALIFVAGGSRTAPEVSRLGCMGGLESMDMRDEVTATRRPAAAPSRPATARLRAWLGGNRGLVLAVGVIAFGITIALYVFITVTHPLNWAFNPVDLRVYREGGSSIRHIAPWYSPHSTAPLYSWPHHYTLEFTYPPFAALLFTVLSLPSMQVMERLWVGVNIVALLVALWATFGGLGYRNWRVRGGATLLVAAVMFWTEPVQRVLYLGQIGLVLLALVLWDVCQPDRRWWKGAGIGIAAGIKLVPLIFIPYLLLTRRFRQAAVAAGAFVATVLVSFAVVPGDSVRWWLHGLFLQGGRTGFVAWEGNQSLRAIITRFVGSVATAAPVWLAAAALTTVIGLACAAMLDRYGHRMLGVLACALTALLVSPISWDHHWVWIVPAVAVAAHYAARFFRQAGRARAAGWAALGLGGAIVAIFGAWPGSLWGKPNDLGSFSRGLIWAPPNTNPVVYYKHGDQPQYVEYHWHGIQLIIGNLYVLTGIALLALLVIIAIRAARRSSRRPGGRGGVKGRDRGGENDSTGSGQAQQLRLAGDARGLNPPRPGEA
jgi:alpha-1,2-mannosyltransferase